MAIKISDVSVSSNTVNVGETVTIIITAVDVNWEVMRNDFENWNDIKTELSSWREVLNYH